MKIETKIYSKNLIIQNLNRQDLNQKYLRLSLIKNYD